MSELLVSVAVVLFIDGLFLLVVLLGPLAIIWDIGFLTAVGVLVAVALPRTPETWDLPHLLSDEDWIKLTEARMRGGWGGIWGGDDEAVFSSTLHGGLDKHTPGVQRVTPRV